MTRQPNRYSTRSLHLRTAALAVGLLLACCLAKGDDATPAVDSVPPRGPFTIVGHVVDQAGKPVSGAKVRKTHDPLHSTLVTAADGSFRYTCSVPGNNYLSFVGESADGTQQGVLTVIGRTANAGQLTLKPAREFNVTVTDAQGTPIDASRVIVLHTMTHPLASGMTNGEGRLRLRIDADATVTQVAAYKSGQGFSYYSTLESKYSSKRNAVPDNVRLTLTGAQTVRLKAIDSAGQPISGINICPWTLTQVDQPEEINLSGCHDLFTTDANGIATYDWLPANHDQAFRFLSYTVEYRLIGSDNITVEKNHDALTVCFLRGTKISGRVTFADGRPAENIAVSADSDRQFTRPDGSYEMLVNSDRPCFVHVEDERWAAQSLRSVFVEAGQPVKGHDIVLQKGTIIRGQMTYITDNQPVPNKFFTMHQPLVNVAVDPRKPGEPSRNYEHQHHTFTDREGNYRFCVGPGTYKLWGTKFVVDGQKEIVHNLRDQRPPVMGPLLGRVIDAQGKPVVGAQVEGAYSQALHVTIPRLKSETQADGHFEVERGMYPALLFAKSPDGSQAAIVQIDAKQSEVTIQLGPVASATGRLISTQGVPLPQASLEYGVKVFNGVEEESSYSYRFGNKITTDAEGRYTLTCLVPGQVYAVMYRNEAKKSRWPFTSALPRGAELLELFDTQLPDDTIEE